MKESHIRNFCIVAHIDHGKSTLADRLLEATGTVAERDMSEQLLDDMELERERGITIKARAVRMNWVAANGEEYEFNLIDTPGHVDFSYEVSRSLAACEGALLVVDATQGVEAQTLANAYLAIDHDLEVMPVLNKIDLVSAEPARVKEEIEEVVGLDTSDALEISAKTGVGVPALLQAIVDRVPPPKKGRAKLRGLLFDSWFDPYHGAMIILRIFDGRLRKGDRVRLMRQGGVHEITKVGVFAPEAVDVDSLGPGEVGFVAAGIKDIHEARVGDTITHRDDPCEAALEGFVAVKPMVFVGLYPVDSNQYEALRDAIEKLKLNDSSFSSEPETSAALGFGFRCGFLGLLHIEITQERLEREFGLELVTTAPTVAYLVTRKDGSTLTIDSPAQLPDPVDVENIAEPWIAATIHVPADHLGGVLGLCEDRRGVQSGMDIHGGNRAVVRYDLPMAEVVYDFYDRLKSVSRGYASLDYEPLDFRVSKLGRLDLLLNGERVDALSVICHSDRAYRLGKELALKLKKIIPRQMYEVVIQAATGSRVIARETVKALRKNVTAKCYGGDITRKRKLLEKQKEGKKRMKQVGRVEIPQEAFLAVLKIDG
ncbi:MAG TPA: elongation factor 4 [Deltaproteobacteria bacterium]|nr:elongation factor 4 [Candidatus Binatota bacterium]HIL13494.1 elongation factor 4 [Deltaproteobacteria bacterium]